MVYYLGSFNSHPVEIWHPVSWNTYHSLWLYFMKYVARLCTDPAANRFLLKMAPLSCSRSRTEPNLLTETSPNIKGHIEQLIFHQVMNFAVQFEKTCLNVHPACIHCSWSMVLQSSGSSHWAWISFQETEFGWTLLTSSAQGCGVRLSNIQYSGDQTEKSDGLFQLYTLRITQTAYCWRMHARGYVWHASCPDGSNTKYICFWRHGLQTSGESRGSVLHLSQPKFLIFLGHIALWPHMNRASTGIPFILRLPDAPGT